MESKYNFKNLLNLTEKLKDTEDVELLFNTIEYINQLELSISSLKKSTSRAIKLLKDNGYEVIKKE